MPALLYVVFQRSEKAVGEWLGQGFDADTEMLELINSGRLSDSPVGKYLHTMKAKFRGPVVADLLCYLRLYTELALRAKGILMMRENGFEVPVDEPTRAKFAELSYLETEHRQDRPPCDPADVPHEPQGPVAALHAGEIAVRRAASFERGWAIVLMRQSRRKSVGLIGCGRWPSTWTRKRQ